MPLPPSSGRGDHGTVRWRRGSRGGRDGYLRPYLVGATALIVLGVLCVLVELQSPSLVLWSGERVRGTNDGGIVYYTVAGEQRTLDAKGEGPAHPEPATVYADPRDPSRDMIATPAKWFDAFFVLVPFAAAGVVLAAGTARRRRFRRRVAAAEQRRRDDATDEWLRSGRGAGPPPSRSTRRRRSSR